MEKLLENQGQGNLSTEIESMKIKHYPIMAKLVTVEPLTKKIKKFVLEAPPKIVKISKPGQFVMVWIPGVDEIPISIADASENSITLIVAARGDATKSMHKMKKGELIGIRGPYGKGFVLDNYKKMLFIAGGYGVAPLIFAAKIAKMNNQQVYFIFGAKSSEDIFLKEIIEKVSSRVIYTTEDGSLGIKGTVIDAINELNLTDFDTCLVCGPEDMIKAIWGICKANNLKMQASLERYMKCGFGICGTCALGPYLVCKDGPVFSNAKLRIIEKFW